MKDILERDVEWLVGWLSSKEETPHTPQPYLYLADRLMELGMTEKANEIRITEREKNLDQLQGMDGIWQWIVGETTQFGYGPQRTLVWLLVLIGAGVVLIKLSDIERSAEWRRKKPRQFWNAAGAIIALSMAIWVLWGVATEWNWDAKGYGTILMIGVMSAILALAAPRMALRRSERGQTDEGERTSLKSAILYSIDRAVPFLGFDSEHVNWFQDKHR